MRPVLSIEKVRKSFSQNTVLGEVSLEVPEHTATVLIGASGSGKSTLLRCINLLEQIDDGAIYLDEKEITSPLVNVDEARMRMGIVFQSFNLFPHMRVIDNITLAPIKVHKVKKEQARAEAKILLEKFGLLDKAEEFPDRLSGGQQQRVAIIRSIATHPRALLLDEITSALDPVLVNEVLAAITELKQEGMTMVIATHEMNFAHQVANEVCFLHNGFIAERGPAAQVLQDPQDIRTKEFLRKVSLN
ncbi:MAG: amino acid ABC transporter ATP-binding protein [Candidatus Nanopelagicales bacterium]